MGSGRPRGGSRAALPVILLDAPPPRVRTDVPTEATAVRTQARGTFGLRSDGAGRKHGPMERG